VTRYSPRTGQPSTYQVGPYDIEHVLIQWGGTLPGNEQWTCSLRAAPHSDVQIVEEVTQADCDAWCKGAIKDAVLAFHQRATTRIYGGATLTYVKANRITTAGHYKDSGTSEFVFPANTTGGAPTLVNGQFLTAPPNQIALAVTLTTGFSRGPAHKGRIYLPMPLVVLGADGLMSSDDADAVKSSVKTFLEAIADTPGLDGPNSYTPCVISRNAGHPARREITGASVGRVLDTQRRRRKSLPESYRNATLSLGAF
jgi:hypothetical protein